MSSTPENAPARRHTGPISPASPDAEAIQRLREWAHATRWVNPAEFADPRIEIAHDRHTVFSLHQIVQEEHRRGYVGPALPHHPRINTTPSLPPATGLNEKFQFILDETVTQQTCSTCHGTRSLTCSPTARCTACGGSGNVPGHVDNAPLAHGRVFCSACSGRGTHTCSTCRGTGTAPCSRCRGNGILWHCTILEIRRHPAFETPTSAAPDFPFKVRRKDWTELPPSAPLTLAERHRLRTLEGAQRTTGHVGEHVTARTVPVITATYLDPAGEWQRAWIVGANHRIVAPSATAARGNRIQSLLLGTLIGLSLVALVLVALIVVVASR